jgi:hypothetical protein
VQFSSLMSKLAGMKLEARISHPSAPSFPHTTEKWKGKWEGAGRDFCPCWLEKEAGRRFLSMLVGEGGRQEVSVHAGWRGGQEEVSVNAGWRKGQAEISVHAGWTRGQAEVSVHAG